MNNKFKGRKVLIFGLGLNQGGVGSAKFFASQGAQVRVTDLKPESILKPSIDELKDFPDIEYTLGKHEYEDILWANLIIKNPAVKPDNPYINRAIKSGKKVEMDMGIFLECVKPGQIIGVTGTKGKSTTASLIYEILQSFTYEQTQKSAGVNTNTNTPQGCTFSNVVLAGNIGKSVLDTIKHVRLETLVVLELSSFQLEAFDQHKVSPKWAVVTNITPDHFNYYKDMEEYVATKRIIGKYQTKNDFLFIRKGDPVTDQSNFIKGFKAKIIRFSTDDLPKAFKPYLMGEHNLENMTAALAVGRTFGIREKTILNTLSKFKGVPFRMEFVKTWQGVKIYNDTTATSPEAGIQAIKTLLSHMSSGNTYGELILICGGMNKGMDYTRYATIVGKMVKKAFFLEGDSTDAIISSLRGARNERRSNLTIHGTYNDLEKLLKDVKKEVKSGDIVLFSPAATSFNLFQNEFDRGRKFNEAVEKVFGEETS